MSRLTGERCPVSLLYLPKRLPGYSRTWQDRCGECRGSLSYLLSMTRENHDLLVSKVIYCLYFVEEIVITCVCVCKEGPQPFCSEKRSNVYGTDVRACSVLLSYVLWR